MRVGAGGDQTIRGGAEGDVLQGRGGDDALIGAGGNDRLDGGTGDDILSGGAGRDGLFGSEGEDVLVFEAGFGNDTVLDFDAGADTLDLDALQLDFGFEQLVIEQRGSGTFVALDRDMGGVADTADPIVLLNTQADDTQADDLDTGNVDFGLFYFGAVNPPEIDLPDDPFPFPGDFVF